MWAFFKNTNEFYWLVWYNERTVCVHLARTSFSICAKNMHRKYGIIFWTIVTDAWGYSGYIFRNDSYSLGTYIYACFSRCIWVIPAILLIIRHSDKLEIHKHELYQPPRFDNALSNYLAEYEKVGICPKRYGSVTELVEGYCKEV